MVEMFNALVEVLEDLIAKIMEFVDSLKYAANGDPVWKGWADAEDAE